MLKKVLAGEMTAFFHYGLSFVLLCALCALVVFFSQHPPAEDDVPAARGIDPLARHPLSVATPRVQTPRHAVRTQGNLFAEDVSHAFYQTIIRNDLFAPLGTVLNPKPVVGAHLTLLATFVREAPAVSTALLGNRTTGQNTVIAVGESLGEFRLTEVQSKNVTLDYNGESVRVSLSPTFFLNAKRR